LKARRSAWLRYWLPPLAVAAALFVQSSLPAPTLLPLTGFRASDKAAHAAVYGLLAWLLFRAFRGARGMTLVAAARRAFLLAALYGITDELHQGLVPSRSMDLADWLADAAGAATVFLALPAARRTRGLGGTSAPPPG
jgi:VanZ family protein